VLSYDSHIHAEHEMQFAGHPIIELHGFWWIKYWNKPDKITSPFRRWNSSTSSGEIWYGYKLLNLSFGYFSKEDFTTFSNLGSTDFEDAFPIQEVTTGSAFVIVPLKI
jgi:trans-2,3-dihydro-3-hydroxyanthranilate isomerase